MVRLSAFVAVASFVASTGFAAEPPKALRQFENAQRAYHQKDYDRAVALLKEFLKTAPPDSRAGFGAIEQVARIHLQFKRDPDGAIAFLESIKKSSKLKRESADTVEEWLATAREWKKMGKLGAEDNADELFKLGLRYYNRGITETGASSVETGAASRYIAASYLVPFVLNFDGDPRIARALLMLGDIRRRSYRAEEWWSVDFYLKEVIRRFPKTKEAQQAYTMLADDVQMRWSGSGSNPTPTPAYLQTMLKRYRALAYGQPATERPPKSTKK